MAHVKKTHIIIGASAAGISAANKLRQLDTESTIVCISDEQEMPYNKCMLADYLGGIKQESQVYTLTSDQEAQKNITLVRGVRVTQLLPNTQQIVLADGTHMAYDTLLLGMGTSPILPSLEGIQLHGVFTFHRLRDMQGIMAYIRQHAVQKVVVVGAGLSGLECADALLHFNVEVSVVEMHNQVLSSLIDSPASDIIQQKMASHNIHFYGNHKVEKLMGCDGRVTQVQLASGQILSADIVVFAVGLRPNMELVQSTSIAVDDCGILTNEYMQTSIATIYAAGDIVMVTDQLSGQLVPSRLWPDAMLQGLVAACSMAGPAVASGYVGQATQKPSDSLRVTGPRAYPGIAPVVSSSFFGIKFVVCGPILANPADCQVIVNQRDDFYHLFLVADNRLKGFLLVGNTSKVGQLRQALMTKAVIDANFLLS